MSEAARAAESPQIPFDNTYVDLPERFYARVSPVPVRDPGLVRLNAALARELGLEPGMLASAEGVEVLAGNRMPEGADPIALAYAGHQFGHYVPQLGDGRTLLLGEVVDRHGVRRDIQLKGTGVTPFSRAGDGRAPIGPVVREYLASEAMAALGIPTTRALAAVSTGEPVLRHGVEPGGVLARVARSHVRVGTFEYFARVRDTDAVRALADYAIQRHDPELAGAQRPYLALLEAVVRRQARLVADWMLVGFVHGVMNTDNTSIAGETIDYGPFGFVDAYDPRTVYSSVDAFGRYAYDQQPRIAQWNLARFAEALVPLFDDDIDRAIEQAQHTIEAFTGAYEPAYHAGLLRKIGLPEDDDPGLARELLDIMHREQADMTLTFRTLSHLGTEPDGQDEAFRQLFAQPAAVDPWLERWRQRLKAVSQDDAERRRAMQQVNPAFILRNHLAQWAVDAATESLDFEPMDALLRVLERPYQDQPDAAPYAQPPQPGERVTRTFCGT